MDEALPTPMIERLPTRVINQIAAGEVVVRPASAVKELIENALDSGARRVEVSVEDDALGFMVRDDGCGMDRGNLELAVERHATSKIRMIDDLENLGTRGFRGEALAAISAVSRLEILTRTADAGEGWRLKCSGGGAIRIQAAGANPGTTITVRDLFFNTPARQKFMKSTVAEWGQILQTFVRQALTRPDVAFSIRWKGRPYLDLPAEQKLIDRLAQILPGTAGSDLIEVDHTLHDVRVWGAISGPRSTRRDRRYQYYFANGRPIVCRPLQFALQEAYRGLIMTQQFPLGALLIVMPGPMLDVNVHPTKEEVRFHQEGLISGAVHRAASEALRGAELVPTLKIDADEKSTPQPTASPRDDKLADRFRQFEQRHGTGSAATQGRTQTPGVGSEQKPLTLGTPTVTPYEQAPLSERPLEFVPGFGLETQASTTDTSQHEPPARQDAGLIARLKNAGVRPRVMGQVLETYILADAGSEGILLLDQHAAHEKILYLKFMRQCERSLEAIEVQPLMVPHNYEASNEELALLEALAPALARAGFEAEPFGGNNWVIQSVPVLFEKLNVPAFLRDLLDDVGQGDLPKQVERLLDKINARASCRAAVKAGDPLNTNEMQRLVDQVMETEAALRCPHGRPTMLLLTREHLDRQFGRLG